MAEQAPSGAQRKNPDDVKIKRDLVLAKYQGFKDAAKMRRGRLEGAKKFHQFKRDADELEAWISEKLQLVSEDSFKDRANLQVLLCDLKRSMVGVGLLQYKLCHVRATPFTPPYSSPSLSMHISISLPLSPPSLSFSPLTLFLSQPSSLADRARFRSTRHLRPS